MDSSLNNNYHQLSYSPYPVVDFSNNPSNYSMQSSVYNYQKSVTPTVPDYSSYTNYLYPSSVASDNYSYYAKPQEYGNNVGSYYTQPTSNTPKENSFYQQQSQSDQATKNRSDKNYSYDLYSYKNNDYPRMQKQQACSLETHLKEQPTVKKRPTSKISSSSNQPKSTNPPVILRNQDKVNKGDHSAKYKSYYDTTERHIHQVPKEKRFSMLDDIDFNNKNSPSSNNNSSKSENQKVNNRNYNSLKIDQNLEKGSPLFLKIMSKLSEMPDLSRKNLTAAPGAPGNNFSLRANQTTTDSATSTDSKLHNNTFSLPSIKMTEKSMNSLNGKSSNGTVAPQTPTRFSPQMSNYGYHYKATETEDKKHNTEEYLKQDSTETIETSHKSTRPATPSSIKIPNFDYEPKSTPQSRHSNRYTSIIETQTPAQVDDTKSKPTTQRNRITKEVEESLKNYFQYLENQSELGKNQQEPGSEHTSNNRNSIESKKFNTFNNLSVYNDPKYSREETGSNKENFELYIERSSRKPDSSKRDSGKFATVTPSDLRKKINDAFKLLNETQNKTQSSQVKKSSPSATESLVDNKAQNFTEEIEKAADFTSSNESLKITENVNDSKYESIMLNSETDRSQVERQSSFGNTPKIINSYMNLPSNRIEIRVNSDEHENSNNELKTDITHEPETVQKYDSLMPDMNQKRIEPITVNHIIPPKVNVLSNNEHSKKESTEAVASPRPEVIIRQDPKIKLRAKTNETRHHNENSRRSVYDIDTISLHSYRYKRMINNRPKTDIKEAISEKIARKLSTPPPTPPNLIDKNYLSVFPSKLKTDNGKSTISSNTRPISITSSIRSGKSEKPVRVHHGPPPPPVYNTKRQSHNQHLSSYHDDNTEHTESEHRSKSSNKRNIPLSEIEKIIKLGDDINSWNTGYEKYLRETSKDKSKRDSVKYRSNCESSTPSSAFKKHNSGETSQKSKPSKNSMKRNSKLIDDKSEEKVSGRTTNLPQLGKIDYIYKKNDDQLMTSFGSFNDEKKVPGKYKSSSKRPITPLEQQHIDYNNTSSKNPSNDGRNFTQNNTDNSLPWTSQKDIENGRNFYQKYSKENDRRKKEGNGFLMLLPGIAIPIDTDAEEEDLTSEDSE